MRPTIQVRDVLRSLGGSGDDARARVMAEFKANGGNVDRWSRDDWRTMAGAITATEDALESESRCVRPSGPRLALRGVRRRIEDAVDLDVRDAARAAAAAARAAAPTLSIAA